MSDIAFDNGNFKYKSRVILGQSEVPKMTRFLMSKGIVKSEKQAQSVLLVSTVLFLLASIYIFTVFVFEVQLFNKTPMQTPEQIQRIQENRERIEQMRQQRSVDTTNPTNPQ